MTFIPQVQSVVDTNNSTTTLLSSGATFTGTATNVSLYGSIVINSFSDKNSADNGIIFQFSPNGTNWNISASYSSKASVSFVQKINILGEYFRILYTNSTGAAQGVFRLQTILQPYSVSNPINSLENNNSSTNPLGIGGIFTGISTNVLLFSSMHISIYTDQASATNGLSIQFSSDGTNWDNINTYTVPANEYVNLTFAIDDIFTRIIYTNGSVAQSIFRLQTLLQVTTAQHTIKVNNTISDQANSQIVTSLLQAAQDNNKFAQIKSTVDNALYIAIRDPVTAFGEMSIAQNSTVFQNDYVYGLNQLKIYTMTPGTTPGSVSEVNGLAVCTTGASTSNIAYLQTYRSMMYHSGQGLLCRFSALFSTGVANNTQYAGAGNFLSGVYFGYNGTSFGIRKLAGGTLAIQTLTITAGPSGGGGTGNITVNLFDGATTRAFTIGVTTGQTTAQAAATIADGAYTGLYPGWHTSSNANVVTFVCLLAQPNNTVTFSAGAVTGIAATAANVVTGVAPSGNNEDLFVAQTSWNIDVMDGSNSVNNPSGILLVPTNGNVYQISVQYLGFGAITYSIENQNNGLFSPVHQIQFTNSNTVRNLKIPSFVAQLFTRNTTNTTAVSIKSASNYGAIQGPIILSGTKHSFNVTPTTTLSSGTAYMLFAIQTSVSYNNILSASTLIPISATFDTAANATFVLQFYYGAPGKTIVFSSQNSWSSVPTTVAPSGTTNALISAIGGTTMTVPTTLGNLFYTVSIPTAGNQVIDLTQFDLIISNLECLYVVATPSANSTTGQTTFSFQWAEL